MKKLLLSIATPEIRTIAEPFLQTHKEWAERHGYVYQCAEEVVWKEKHPSFSRVPMLQKALADTTNEWVIWVDSDIAFMDMRVDLADLIRNKPEFFLAGLKQANWKPYPYMCAGLLVFHNSDYSRWFVDEWADRCVNGCKLTHPGKRTIIDYHPFEQYLLDGLIRETEYKGIYHASHKEIGCFCPSMWHDNYIASGGEPTMHFAAGEWTDRARIFTEQFKSKIAR